MTTGTEVSEVLNAPRLFEDDALAGFQTYGDVAAAFSERLGVPLESVTDYGTGFVLVEKESLVGIPHVIVQWRFNAGEYGEEFVSVEAITKNNDKVIYNDGSTGIYAQLRQVTNKRLADKSPVPPQAGLVVSGGLSKTSYYYNEVTKQTVSRRPEGAGKEWKPASTYYLAG